VHRATTHAGMPVAVKIQYAGVADSIDADIAILGTLLSPLAPRGLFLSTALSGMPKRALDHPQNSPRTPPQKKHSRGGCAQSCA
jgi:hypothetical protein